MPDPDTLKLTDADAANFETLQRAFANEDVALLSTRWQVSGNPVALICAVMGDGEEIEMVPLATLVTGNPYELFEPPAPPEEDKTTDEPGGR